MLGANPSRSAQHTTADSAFGYRNKGKYCSVHLYFDLIASAMIHFGNFTRFILLSCTYREGKIRNFARLSLNRAAHAGIL
jgi:hypothetical protein